jgi:hypothetical protein
MVLPVSLNKSKNIPVNLLNNNIKNLENNTNIGLKNNTNIGLNNNNVDLENNTNIGLKNNTNIGLNNNNVDLEKILELNKFDFKDIQVIFKLIYKIIVLIVLLLITIVFFISAINFLYILYNLFNDLQLKYINENLQYKNLHLFKWFKYLNIDYDTYNIFYEEKGVYLQQITLNMAIYILVIMISLLILNFSFYGILLLIFKDKMIGAGGNPYYFIDKDTIVVFSVCFIFCIIVSLLYLLLFQSYIFKPLKDMDIIMKYIDNKIYENIIKDKDVIEKAINGSTFSILKSYIENNISNNNKNELIKVIFTYNIITNFKNITGNSKDYSINTSILEYLTNPLDSIHSFFGFINIDQFLLFQSNSDIISELIGENHTLSDQEILILINNIKNITEEIEEKLKSINTIFNTISDVSYIFIMFFICFLLFIFLIIAFVIPIYIESMKDLNIFTEIFNIFIIIYIFTKNNFSILYNKILIFIENFS